MKKKQRPYAFLQEGGTYSNQIIVAVGPKKKEEVIKLLDKLKTKKEFQENFNKAVPDSLDDLNHSGFCFFYRGATCMWLPEWPKKADWQNYETLLHEVVHVVQETLIKDKQMAAETEGLAYQTEYLFREIRRKLDRVDECKMVSI